MYRVWRSASIGLCEQSEPLSVVCAFTFFGFVLLEYGFLRRNKSWAGNLSFLEPASNSRPAGQMWPSTRLDVACENLRGLIVFFLTCQFMLHRVTIKHSFFTSMQMHIWFLQFEFEHWMMWPLVKMSLTPLAWKQGFYFLFSLNFFFNSIYFTSRDVGSVVVCKVPHLTLLPDSDRFSIRGGARASGLYCCTCLARSKPSWILVNYISSRILACIIQYPSSFEWLLVSW